MNDRKSARNTSVNTFSADLDAAAVDSLSLGQKLQERAIAAADVESTGATLDHLYNQEMVWTRFGQNRLRFVEHDAFVSARRLSPT